MFLSLPCSMWCQPCIRNNSHHNSRIIDGIKVEINSPVVYQKKELLCFQGRMCVVFDSLP
ncbi:hypothetical protein YC2023_064997 [Brassica napus]